MFSYVYNIFLIQKCNFNSKIATKIQIMSNQVVSARISSEKKEALEEKAKSLGHRSLSSYLKEIVDNAITGETSQNKSAINQAKEAVLQLQEKEKTIHALKSKLARLEGHPIMSDISRDGLQLSIDGKKYRFKSVYKLLDRLKKKSRVETSGYTRKFTESRVEEVEDVIEDYSNTEEYTPDEQSTISRWWMIAGVVLVAILIAAFAYDTTKKNPTSSSLQDNYY